MSTYLTGTDQILLNVHEEDKCKEKHCVIHNPSDHVLRDAPTHWREDRRIMERMCEHGIGHPDPDNINMRDVDWIHGCDGCCGSDEGAMKGA
jgi:hypothetical protein